MASKTRLAALCGFCHALGTRHPFLIGDYVHLRCLNTAHFYYRTDMHTHGMHAYTHAHTFERTDVRERLRPCHKWMTESHSQWWPGSLVSCMKYHGRCRVRKASSPSAHSWRQGEWHSQGHTHSLDKGISKDKDKTTKIESRTESMLTSTLHGVCVSSQ